jgi:hypothetical protein
MRWKTVPRLRDPTRQNSARKKNRVAPLPSKIGASGMTVGEKGGAPTFLSLPTPLSLFRIFLNLELTTDNLILIKAEQLESRGGLVP